MNIGLQSMFYKYIWSSNWWKQGREDSAAKHADLRCLRRDSAAFQVLISSNEEELLVTRSRDPLLWKGGPIKIVRCDVETDAPVQAEIKWIGLIEDDNRVMKSDVLLEEPHIYVQKRKIQPAWVELHADEWAKPGVYQGKVSFYAHTMFEDETLVQELTFQLTIQDEMLPAGEEYSFYLDLWQHNCNIARKYEVPYWSDDHFKILDSYLESLGRLGQKALTLVVSEEPWSGQRSFIDAEPSDLNEYSIVPITRNIAGQYDYDFSLLDRYVALGEKHGITQELEVFGLISVWQHEEEGYGSIVEGYPDAIRVRYYDEASKSYKFMRTADDLARYIQALERHFVQKGWIDKVRIVADEPEHIELFEKSLKLLRSTAPAFRYKAAINHTAFIRKGIEDILDYVPALECVADEYEQLMSIKNDVTGKIAYYVCCNPDKPNTFIGSPPIECRVIPWLAEKLNLHGFLRWNYTVWPDDPLNKLSCRPHVWRAGDTNFVYPGKQGKPLLSLRYKWLQRGIRDYEYMQLLKASGYGKQVEELLHGVFCFSHPKELSPASGKTAKELYSFNTADYDRLYEIGKEK